jgi:hypothetical protein
MERGRVYVFAGLTAASGLAGCAPAKELATHEPTPAVWSTPRSTNVQAPKPHVAHTGDTPSLDVIGLDQSQLQSLLGSPAQDSEQLPAMESVFRDGSCALSVTFYPNVQTHIYHALASKVASDVDTVKERRRCYILFAARLHNSKPPINPVTDPGDPR